MMFMPMIMTCMVRAISTANRMTVDRVPATRWPLNAIGPNAPPPKPPSMVGPMMALARAVMYAKPGMKPVNSTSAMMPTTTYSASSISTSGTRRVRTTDTTSDTAPLRLRPSQMAGASKGAATQYKAMKNTDAMMTIAGWAKNSRIGPMKGILQMK
ncbi:hypothetical protein D3C72_1254640 [compost metagenome]